MFRNSILKRYKIANIIETVGLKVLDEDVEGVERVVSVEIDKAAQVIKIYHTEPHIFTQFISFNSIIRHYRRPPGQDQDQIIIHYILTNSLTQWVQFRFPTDRSLNMFLDGLTVESSDSGNSSPSSSTSSTE